MSKLKDLFRLAKSLIEVSNFERRAMIALLFLCLILAGYRWLNNHVLYRFRPLDPQILAQLDLLEKTESTAVIAYAPFDPNTADLQMLMHAGLSEKLASQMINFREKVRPFQTPEDLLVLYAMNDKLFEQLRPYIRISEVTKVAKEPDLTKRQWKPRQKQVKEPSRIPVLELNTCMAEELQLLPGIGPAYAGRIVKYRDLLGGYYELNQLLEVYGLPDSVFTGLLSYLRLDSSGIRKLDLNKSSEEELRRHPYIGYREAKLIVAYRKAHGTINKGDLFKIQALNPEYLDKLMPYLD